MRRRRVHREPLTPAHWQAPGLLALAVLLVAGLPGGSAFTGTGQQAGLWLWRDWWFGALVGDLGQGGPGDWLAVLLSGGVGPDLFSPVDLYLFSLPSWVLGHGAAAWNLKVLLVLAADAAAGYLLGLAVSRNPWGGLLAGCVAAFNPFVLLQVQKGGLREAIVAFPALFGAALARLEESDSPRDAAAAGLALAGSFLTTWLYGLIALLLFACLAGAGELAGLLRRPRQLAACAGLAALLAAPFYGPLLAALAQGHYPWEYPASLASPLDLKMPGEQRALHESSRAVDFLVNPAHGLSLNPLVLALLLLPLARGAGMGGWYLAVAAGYVLCLGPYLHAGPEEGVVVPHGEPVPLPFLALYRVLPGMTWVKSPFWFAPLMYLGMAALGAMNVEALAGRRWAVPALVAGVLAVTALDLSAKGTLPLRQVHLSAPALYTRMDPARDRLVESPGTGDRNLLDAWQAVSGVPVLAGAADREALPGLALPVAARHRTPAEVASLPFVRFVLEPGRFPPGADPSGDVARLRQAGYTVVAVHEDLTRGLAPGPDTFDRMVSLLEPLLGKAGLETETVERFAVTGGRIAWAPDRREWRVAVFRLEDPAPVDPNGRE